MSMQSPKAFRITLNFKKETIMKFNLTIDIDNDAYHNQPVQYQLIDNLKDIIAKLEEANDWGVVKDVNGNFVGNWDISFEEETV